MTADTNGKVSLNGVLDMNISEMTGMQFDVEKISELYNTALSNISRLTVDFSIGINEDKTMTISLNNLDSLASQLTTPVVKTLTAELNCRRRTQQCSKTAFRKNRSCYRKNRTIYEY